MKDRILILGKGFIGKRLSDEFGCAISARRINTLRDAEDEIKKRNPRVLINCIGQIGRNVDDCELVKDKALFANTFVPLILAEAALRHGVKLVHISSGCIYHFDYSKDRPITEERIPDFFELYYSRTKIYAERALEVLCGRFNVLIARIRVPLDNRPHQRNILTKLVSYKKVIDIPNSISYIPDFVKAVKHLIRINARGIYNISNKGSLLYPELMEAYRKFVPDFQYEVIDYKKLHMVRTNLVLSVRKLEQAGFKMRDIHEVLEECVKDYIKY